MVRRKESRVKEKVPMVSQMLCGKSALSSGHLRWQPNPRLGFPHWLCAVVLVIVFWVFSPLPSQGVNVWALVTAIVLLSSSVNDIQQLLFCLRRPGSTVTMPDITETLYCIAVLLYAMREKGINISNR